MYMYKNFFFDLYGTLVDIRTDEQKPSLWRNLAEFYSLCGAPYTPEEIRERYLALCAQETEALAEAWKSSCAMSSGSCLRKRALQSPRLRWRILRCYSVHCPSAAHRG